MLSLQHLPRPLLSPLKPSSTTCSTCSTSLSQTPIRSASLLRRPLRPYTFTQLVQLSDGSTFTHRTTSPKPVYICNKDTRSSPLWNPSSAKLLIMEADESGRLRAFREKFGRGWDAERMYVEDTEAGEGGEESLMDLITGYVEGVGEGEVKRENEGEGRKLVRDRIERERQETRERNQAFQKMMKEGGGRRVDE